MLENRKKISYQEIRNYSKTKIIKTEFFMSTMTQNNINYNGVSNKNKMLEVELVY